MSVPFFRPNLGDEELAAAARVLRSGRLTQGEEVQRFEEEFAAYQGARYAVAVNSCTSALYLALRALGVGLGDGVITTAISWPATALAILWTGAEPIFADVDARGLIDPASVRERLDEERNIGGEVKAIIPVHLYGNPAPADDLLAFGLSIVWDAAHAIELKRGSLPGASCYSFYASKNITTAGEGGMLVTDEPEIAAQARRERLFGMDLPGERICRQMGTKLNMTEVQAAVGREQLRRIDERWHRRRRLVAQYDAALGRTSHVPGSACHLYPIEVDERDRVALALKERGIGTGIHFPMVTAHPFFAMYAGGTPMAKTFGARTLSLPLFPEMTGAMVREIVVALQEATA